MKVALFLPGRIAAVLLASLVLVLLSFNVAAVEATDFADGYTSTAALKGKFGAAKTLNVADKQTAYVQFALDTLPANLTGAEIRKATLRLWVANVTKEGSITVR